MNSWDESQEVYWRTGFHIESHCQRVERQKLGQLISELDLKMDRIHWMDAQIEFTDATDSHIRFTKYNRKQNLSPLKVSRGIEKRSIVTEPQIHRQMNIQQDKRLNGLENIFKNGNCNRQDTGIPKLSVGQSRYWREGQLGQSLRFIVKEQTAMHGQQDSQ